MLKELNSLVELFKLTLACKWRERERKALSGHIYTLPECNPLSRSRGSSTAREGIEHEGRAHEVPTRSRLVETHPPDPREEANCIELDVADQARLVVNRG